MVAEFKQLKLLEKQKGGPIYILPVVKSVLEWIWQFESKPFENARLRRANGLFLSFHLFRILMKRWKL